MSLRLPTRFIALVDSIAAKNNQSRTSVLLQVFILGLREYAILYKLASVPAGEHDSNGVPTREHTQESVSTKEHKSEDTPADDHNQTNRPPHYGGVHVPSNSLHV